MLDERLKENERRRKRTSMEVDPELTQYLEDERLAIALQNSEFLQELRGNEDFMKTLKRGTCLSLFQLTLYYIIVTLTHSHTMTPFDAPGKQAF